MPPCQRLRKREGVDAISGITGGGAHHEARLVGHGPRLEKILIICDQVTGRLQPLKVGCYDEKGRPKAEEGVSCCFARRACKTMPVVGRTRKDRRSESRI